MQIQKMKKKIRMLTDMLLCVCRPEFSTSGCDRVTFVKNNLEHTISSHIKDFHLQQFLKYEIYI